MVERVAPPPVHPEITVLDAMSDEAERVAATYAMAPYERWCNHVHWSELDDGYHCLREKGHDGPHVAHFDANEAVAYWDGPGREVRIVEVRASK